MHIVCCNIVVPPPLFFPGLAHVQVAKRVSALSDDDRRQQQARISQMVQARGLGDMVPLHEWSSFLIRAYAAHHRFLYDW